MLAVSFLASLRASLGFCCLLSVSDRFAGLLLLLDGGYSCQCQTQCRYGSCQISVFSPLSFPKSECLAIVSKERKIALGPAKQSPLEQTMFGSGPTNHFSDLSWSAWLLVGCARLRT